MAIARHGVGPRATLQAAASQIHPVFMLPPIAASWFGAILAGEFSLLTAFLHSLAIFAAVYTAHVKDGFVDFHVRGEDADHPLTRTGCRWCLLGATVVFLVCVLVLWWVVDIAAAALTAPTWLIAYLHAPQLDMHPIGVTLGYPTGIALAVLGGFYVQAGTLTTTVIAIALVFVLLLAGIKIVDDEQDYRYDRSIGKPTVAVRIGPKRARNLAKGLLVGSLAFVLFLVLGGILPPSASGAAVVFGLVILVAIPAAPERATALLIRGAYLFLAVLVVAVWFRPFA